MIGCGLVLEHEASVEARVRESGAKGGDQGAAGTLAAGEMRSRVKTKGAVCKVRCHPVGADPGCLVGRCDVMRRYVRKV